MDRSLLNIILVIVVTLCLPSLSLGLRSGTEDSHDAGHHHDSWAVPDQEERRVNPVPPDKTSLEQGEKLFKTYCAACHGEQGRGDGPAGAGLTRPGDRSHPRLLPDVPEAVRGAGGPPPFRARPGGALRRVEARPSRQGRRGPGRPLCGLRAGPGPGASRRGRGARPFL